MYIVTTTTTTVIIIVVIVIIVIIIMIIIIIIIIMMEIMMMMKKSLTSVFIKFFKHLTVQVNQDYFNHCLNHPNKELTYNQRNKHFAS